MSIRENEEKGNSSDSKMAEIKKKIVEEQQEDEVINLQIGTSNSVNQIDKVPINEESERSPKRSGITESSKKNEQESDSDSDSFDPLLEIERIILKYKDFIDYVYQILKNDEEKQDWSESVERVKMLGKTLNRKLRVVTTNMETFQELQGAEKQYEFRQTHIPNVLTLFRHLNSEIACSSSFKLVSDIKYRGKVLPICVREFERWSKELSELMDSMQTLKEMDLRLEDDAGK